MTVAHDAATSSSTFTTTSPFTFSHAPVGTPRGAIVLISQADATDRVSAVTYGGLALTRIGWKKDSIGLLGSVYLYFLGSGVFGGQQTVSITHDANAVVKHAVSITATGSVVLEACVSALLDGLLTNPSVTLNSIDDSLRYSVFFSGLPDPVSIVEASNQVRLGSIDFGINCAVYSRQTTAPSPNGSLSWTAASADVAIVGLGVCEAALVTASAAPIRGPRRRRGQAVN